MAAAHAVTLSRIARMLGGQGDTRRTWRALAWGSLPQVLALPLVLLEVSLLGPDGRRLEGASAPGAATRLALSVLAYHSILVALAQAGLSLVLVAAAHRFSIGRAIAALLLDLLAFGLVVLGRMAAVT